MSQTRANAVRDIAALLVSLMPVCAWAQPPDQPDAPVEVEPIVVTATRYAAPITEAPASISIVGRPQIERRNAYRIGDVLADVPGLTLRGSAFGESFPASGNGSISMRGVPRTSRTLVLIDGHPLNNALSGAVNLSSINMDEVDRIEVVSGPFSAQYGGEAMGGVIQILTAAPTQGTLTVRAGLGGGEIQQRGASFVWRDRLAGGLGWSIAVSQRRSEGWADSDQVVILPRAGTGGMPVTGAQPTNTPDNRAAYLVGTRGARPWDQLNASATLYGDIGPGTSVAVGVAHSVYHTRSKRPTTLLSDAAGQPVFSGDLSLDDGAALALAEADFLAQTPSSERDLRVFARLDHRAASGWEAQGRISYLDHGFRFPLAGRSARYGSGPGEFIDQPNDSLDLDFSGHLPIDERLALTAGLSASRNRLDRATYAVSLWSDFSTRTNVRSAAAGTTWNQAIYGELQWRPHEDVSVYGAARYDRFETEGRAAQTTPPAFARSFAKRSDGHLAPKLALVYRATPELTLRASYGEGFHAPTLLDLYTRSTAPSSVAGQSIITEASPDLKPEEVSTWEVAGEWRQAGRRLNLSYYEQTLTNLIYRRRVAPLLTQVVNAGDAEVNGLEASFRWPIGFGGLSAFGSATHLFRHTVTKNDAIPASVGRKLPDVPRSSASLGLEGDWGRWSVYGSVRHVGHAFGSGDNLNANTEQGVYGSWDRSTVVDFKVVRRFSRGLSASISFDNLFDANHYAFYHQPGRSFFLEVQKTI